MKKIFFGAVMMLIIIVVTYLLGEVLVYALFRDKIALFPRYVTGTQYGEYKIRCNIPNHRYRHTSVDGKWDFNINSQGFRSDEDFTYEKPKGVIRILTLGDSFTIGFEVHKEETYSAVLEDRLRKQGYNVQVINAGVSGFSNAEELIFLEQEGVKYHPDFVVLGFYDNDLTDNIRADLYRLYRGQLVLNSKEYLPAVKQRDFLHSIPFYSWLSEHSYLHNYLTQAATVLVRDRVENENLGMFIEQSGIESSVRNVEDYQKILAYGIVKRIHEVAKQNGAYFVLMDIPHYLTIQPSFPRLYDPSKICDYFFNSYDEIIKHKDEGYLYRPHAQHHWTEISHKAAGEKLAEIIAAEIERKKSAK